MRAMVTGANGFVGTSLVGQLATDHDVIAVDALRHGPWRLPEDLPHSVERHEVDLRDTDATAALVEATRPDAIVHLAAIHFIPECENDPAEAIRTNLLATVNLATACPSGARLVIASTAAVYGPSDVPHHEDRSALGPMDVYGFTKQGCEDYVRYFAQQRGFDAVIVRLFNVVGPGETNPHFIPEVVAQLRGGATTLRLGNLHTQRDLIHVDDAARGFAMVATSPWPVEGRHVTVNLGTGTEHSMSEVVDRLTALTRSAVTVEIDPGRVRPVDRPHLAADNTRIGELFGWYPKADLAEALDDVWREAGAN